ncbi:hypothetical protein B7W85_07020 [Allorhizobium ampelinum]|nr:MULTISPECIES: hypothetical protein [Rhizobium/Agrobacterium group]MCF1481686.1 hypothetical protein [Allorhizobium ampelinum]NSZ42543.1 hypothetical protein [Agrobacterium vitis]NTA26251.1 hypothetical protein [Allorhizobium ampelinum]OVE95555.1 hypothetical protein B7W85_07020 [Allorhizobium ampelinum]
MSIKQSRRTEADSSVKNCKPKPSTVPNGATAETIPRFRMRTKNGAMITVPHVTAHVKMIAHEQRRRRVMDFKNAQPQTRER